MEVDLTVMPTVAVHRSLGAVLGIPMPEVSIVFWPEHRPSAYSLDRVYNCKSTNSGVD